MNIIHPSAIPLRSIGDRFLSAAETNGLISAARNVITGPNISDGNIVEHELSKETILITASENIDRYSIFTIEKDTATYRAYIPTGDSLQISDTNAAQVYVTNVDTYMYSGVLTYCFILGADRARLLSYDDADGTPVINKSIGPKPGTYKVSAKYAGLIVAAPPDTTNKLVWCVRYNLSDWNVGVLDDELVFEGSATVSIWRWTGAVWADSGINLEAYDWLLEAGQSVAIGKRVVVQLHKDGIWVVTEAQCP
jgi:hypothetical protein